MATFSFNFDIGIDSSAANDGAVVPVSEHSTRSSVSEWREGTVCDEAPSDSPQICQCGILDVTEVDVAALCCPYAWSGAEIDYGATSDYSRELVQLSDGVGVVCLTKALHESSERLTKEGSFRQAEGPCRQPSGVERAQKANSDLIAGVYEGGMKIWECAVDLATFLLTNETVCCSGKRVIELGCGVGLPAVCAMLQAAKLVAFQDYNAEVLTSRTIPTAFYNGTLKNGQFQNVEEFSKVCQFCYGDWGVLVQKMSRNGFQWKHGFDVILASETIYCRENYHKFLSAVKYFLEPSGVVCLAAKSYYFGVGGSVAEFREFIITDGYFDVTEVASFGQDTVHRTILMLSVRHRVCEYAPDSDSAP